MLNMSDNSVQFLQEWLPVALNAEALQDALWPLYDLIMEKGFTPPNYEEYNDFGRRAQQVYDDIYYSNKQFC